MLRSMIPAPLLIRICSGWSHVRNRLAKASIDMGSSNPSVRSQHRSRPVLRPPVARAIGPKGTERPLELVIGLLISVWQYRLLIAREQYVYCSDIVEQGAQTLSALAAVLMESDWLYFWWD